MKKRDTNKKNKQSNNLEKTTHRGEGAEPYENDDDWKEVTNKKRQRNGPGEQARFQKQTKLNSYWQSALVTTSNNFSSLDDVKQQEEEETKVEKVAKPPPIYVAKVINIQPLTYQ